MQVDRGRVWLVMRDCMLIHEIITLSVYWIMLTKACNVHGAVLSANNRTKEAINVTDIVQQDSWDPIAASLIIKHQYPPDTNP